MRSDDFIARERPIGATENRLALRRLEIQAKELSSADQAVPFRVIFGTARVSGDSLTPTFNMRAVPLTTNVSK